MEASEQNTIQNKFDWLHNEPWKFHNIEHILIDEHSQIIFKEIWNQDDLIKEHFELLLFHSKKNVSKYNETMTQAKGNIIIILIR